MFFRLVLSENKFSIISAIRQRWVPRYVGLDSDCGFLDLVKMDEYVSPVHDTTSNQKEILAYIYDRSIYLSNYC